MEVRTEASVAVRLVDDEGATVVEDVDGIGATIDVAEVRASSRSWQGTQHAQTTAASIGSPPFLGARPQPTRGTPASPPTTAVSATVRATTLAAAGGFDATRPLHAFVPSAQSARGPGPEPSRDSWADFDLLALWGYESILEDAGHPTTAPRRGDDTPRDARAADADPGKLWLYSILALLRKYRV